VKLKTITLLNNDFLDIFSQEYANEFTISEDKIKIKNNDKLYLFSYLLSSKVIELNINKITANILKNIDIPLKEKKEIIDAFVPSEYSKIILTHLLYQYFLENNEINIEGFLNFRIEFLNRIIQKEIEKEIRKRRIEREYDNFISLLKYYVSIQKTKTSKVSVEILPENDFRILDENSVDITQNLKFEFIEDMRVNNGEKIKNDDLLISILIYLSPQKIIFQNWNNLKNYEIKKTIQDVFENKIIFRS